jgi:hypothetical protein
MLITLGGAGAGFGLGYLFYSLSINNYDIRFKNKSFLEGFNDKILFNL